MPSHYEEYPYPDPNLYRPDQIKDLRTDNAPRRATWEQWFPGEEPGPKRVLVIGCGVWEALAVAIQEPLLDVTGIDISEQSIELARERAAFVPGGVPNLGLLCHDFMSGSRGTFGSGPFDLVIASGVLHHVEDDDEFVERVALNMAPDGQFSVMVYGDCFRGFIPPLCNVLRELGIRRDATGIAFVRGLIASLPQHHPARQFALSYTDYDAQIVDIWLHPFFRQYSADDLIYLMEKHGLRFTRWLDKATDHSLFSNLPPEYGDIAKRFEQMDCAVKSRIGQVINHADHKLKAVFTRNLE